MSPSGEQMSDTLSAAAAIRAGLDFPIVDGDGHLLEMLPVFVEYVRETSGERWADAFATSTAYQRFCAPWDTTDDARRDRWISMPNLWSWPTKNTLDRATATVPGLYASRMDVLGIDFSILYPSAGLFIVALGDPELREEINRAYNRWVMELCGPYRDRMAPVALIPMNTPEEAIRHLDYAVGELGHKVVCLQGFVARPIEAAQRTAHGAGEYGVRLDYFGLDSDYDYDPVWARCVELKVAPTFHSATGLRGGRSVTNYTYNHIGQFAQAEEGLAKALFLGGVTHRFPTLNFGFLESGAGWMCSLLSDLVGHYERRNLQAMAYVDPAQLDVGRLMGYIESHGDAFTRRHIERARSYYGGRFLPLPDHDDFSRTGVGRAQDVIDAFVPRFYVGCEADDRSVAWAFDARVNPGGSRIRAMFGSDVGHWDVTDVGEVVVEAHELVEHGLVTADDFRQFMFGNPVELHAGMNPDFFTGTRVEREVADYLAGKVSATAADAAGQKVQPMMTEKV